MNCNKKDLLKTCLGTVRTQSFKGIETIVADNGFSDESAELIKIQIILKLNQ